MTRLRLFFAAVLAALATALAGGFGARPPAGRPPAYALGSALVWHVEVAVVLFVVLYATVITVRLAFHGMTVTHVRSRGIDIPQLGEQLRRRDHKARVDSPPSAKDDPWGAVDLLTERIAAFERPGGDPSTQHEKEARHDVADR